jgi:hypothetical protein
MTLVFGDVVACLHFRRNDTEKAVGAIRRKTLKPG